MSARSTLYCPPGSLLDDDLKAGGSIEIGAASLCRGNVTTHAGLTLGEDCLFSGDLRAATTVHLASGTRGFREGSPVLVSAGQTATLELNVVVRGRLLSENVTVGVSRVESAGLERLLAEASPVSKPCSVSLCACTLLRLQRAAGRAAGVCFACKSWKIW